MAERLVALVTGAGGAIGQALVRRLVVGGYVVVGSDLAGAPPSAIAGVVADWRPADVTSGSAMRGLVDDVVTSQGRLDLLVLNAGVTALGTLADTEEEVFTRTVDVNLHGPFRLARAALPALRRSRGRIVVLSSVAGFAPVAGRPAYTASKHAVTGLFESVRHELAADGIGLTMVYPTFLATSPADLNAAPDPGEIASASRSVAGPLLGADDVAAAVVEAVRLGRPTVRPGRTARAAYHLHRLLPGVYRRVMLRRLR